MKTPLQRLADWFKSQCDGLWEHDWGITLQTLDNPGWMLEINLDGTELYDRPFKPVKHRRSATDWIECAIQDHGRAGGDREGRVFVGAGGSGNLEEIISTFCDWAERSMAKPLAPKSSGSKPPRPQSSGPRRR